MTIKATDVSHEAALNALGWNRSGLTAEMSNPEAIAIWEALAQRQPNDAYVWHHLAVAYHARAFDLELSPQPTRANSAWTKALVYWHRVWRHDVFWQALERSISPSINARLVERVRSELPRQLLQIHCDIAFDARMPLHRQQFHLRLLSDSPFAGTADAESPASHVEAVIDDAYNDFVRDLPPEVWDESIDVADIIDEGLQRIEEFLERCPDSRTALSDALRLQQRLLESSYRDFLALEVNDKHRRRLQEEYRRTADYWGPRFRRLVDQAERLDDETRSRLARWYRDAGDVIRSPQRAQQAMDLYELGERAAPENDPDRELCRQGLAYAHALQVRERACRGHSDAHTQCDRVFKNFPHTVTSAFVLANAYQLLKDYDQAEAVAAQALQTDLAARDRDRQQLEELLDKGRFDRQTFASEFGNRQGWEARQRAILANNDNQYETAVADMREAVAQAPNVAARKAELAQVLVNAANSLGDQALRESERAKREEIAASAVRLLHEAIAADPQNKNAVELLEVVMDLADR